MGTRHPYDLCFRRLGGHLGFDTCLDYRRADRSLRAAARCAVPCRRACLHHGGTDSRRKAGLFFARAPVARSLVLFGKKSALDGSLGFISTNSATNPAIYFETRPGSEEIS